jgi:hypothetical protein
LLALHATVTLTLSPWPRASKAQPPHQLNKNGQASKIVNKKGFVGSEAKERNIKCELKYE